MIVSKQYYYFYFREENWLKDDICYQPLNRCCIKEGLTLIVGQALRWYL